MSNKYCVINSLSIQDGITGVTYEELFCNYLKGATSIEIREPYLRNNHQLGNLKKFIELLKEQEINICVDLITAISTGRFASDFTKEQQFESLNSLAAYLHDRGIEFNYGFDNRSHVRRITADNETIIKSDRGLHIYKEFEAYNGEDNFSLRICKMTEVDYIKPLEFEPTSYIVNDDIGEQGEPDGPNMVGGGINEGRTIVIGNITANDVRNKKIRVLTGNKHLFPREIQGQRNSYVLPMLYQNELYDFKYTTIFTGDNPISGIIRLGSELYGYIGIEEGTTLSIELRDDGVYVMNKFVGGENGHRG